MFLLFLLPTFLYAANVEISGYSQSSTYNGYPLFEIIKGSKTSIIISSTGGQFDYVYVDDVQIEYNTSSYWYSYTLDISMYDDGKQHKLQLKRGSADYGVCYFKITSLISFGLNWNKTAAYVSGAAKSITVANIPAEYEYEGQKYPVTSINSSAFKDCKNLTSVIIPNTITSIKDEAFSGCSNLTSVELPNSLSSIGERAFYGTGLTSITIPESVTSINGYAFYNIQSLTDVYFYAKSCGGNHYYDGCPDGDDWCYTVDPIFSSTIKNVVIGQGVSSIPNGIFRGCKELTSVNLPEGVTSIGHHAFSFCAGLTEINIPSTVTSIGGDAFYMCNGLQIAEFASLESLCNMSFNGVPFGYEYSNPLTYAKTSFIGGKRIVDIVIPNTVTTIQRNVFNGCKSLVSVVIPASVEAIKDRAFFSCNNLKSVYCLSDVPPTLETIIDYDDYGDTYEDNVFSYTNATLYVPQGKVSAYQSSKWSLYFKNFVELDDILTVEITGYGVVLNDLTKINDGSKYIGSDFEFYVLPDNGNVVSSITFEGQDITSSLVNHKLTISDFKGEGDGVLKIEFAPEADATLVVKGADTHAIRHTYKEGTSAVVELQPEEGWKIHSVTYNGEDVTDRLENNVFMTEPLHGENNLNMVLVSNSTVDIEAVSAADGQVRISVNRNTVSIMGLDDDEPVSVYDVSGKTIYTGFDRSVTLKSGEAYILTTPSKAFKVAI